MQGTLNYYPPEKPNTKAKEKQAAKAAMPYRDPSSVEMKYVQHSTVGFVIWPMHLGEGNMFHSTIGRALRYQPEQSGQGDFVVSAGFCSIIGGKVRCYGESESLGLRSKAGDSAKLANQLGLEADPLGA